VASRRTKTLILTSVLVPVGRFLYGQWQQRKAASKSGRFATRRVRRRS